MEMKSTDPERLNASAPGSTDVTRRTLLKSAAAIAFATLFPFGFAEAAFSAQNTTSTKQASSALKAPAKNPRWYGFNLLEYFSTDPDWMKYFPYKDDGLFREDDFRWIRDWGFNWVRLPMDYRFWTDPRDHFKIYEEKIIPIDRAVRLGEKYGIHVDVCLHRAPGYCILDTMNESLTGIHITKETTDLFTDPKTQDAFVYQWTYFADRYKGVTSDKLSFNLVNEPLIQPTAAELQELAKAGITKPEDIFKSAVMKSHEKDCVRVAAAAVDGIRKHDSQRLVITDGLVAGNVPIPELFDWLGTAANLAAQRHQRQRRLRSQYAHAIVSALGKNDPCGRADSFWRNGMLQAHPAPSRSCLVQRHLGRAGRFEYRLGVVEFPWSFRRARHGTSGHEVRKLASSSTRSRLTGCAPAEHEVIVCARQQLRCSRAIHMPASREGSQ